MQDIYFLTVEEIIIIHEIQIKDSGGKSGILNMGLLESAAATPQTSFAGYNIYNDIYQMAAALMYHLVKNHPFYDANKRTAVVSTVVFLESNDIQLNLSDPQIYELTIDIAKSNSIDSEKVKENLAKILEIRSSQLISPKSRRRDIKL